MEEITQCPLCKSPRKRFFEEMYDSDRQVKYQICQRCGLVYQSPRMDESELKKFYEREYRIQRQETEDPIEKDLQMQEARARMVLEMVGPRLPQMTRHLDIGSSSGALLMLLQEEFGCASIGVEPGEAYRVFSQSYGLTVYPSLDALAEAKQAPFDFLSMLHVLEHLVDPVGRLRFLRKSVMSPGGYLLLEVPNLIEHESLELSHLYAFSQSTLKETVRQAGFRVLWSKAHGGFRSPILNLYVTLLAQAETDRRPRRVILSSPIGVKPRRRLGKLKRTWFTSRFPDWTWQAPS